MIIIHHKTSQKKIIDIYLEYGNKVGKVVCSQFLLGSILIVSDKILVYYNLFL